MNDSLSIILPVHNAQATLADELERLLEVAPELTARFDLLIIDDGSRDGTEEIACELAARYAQVHLLRHPLQLGDTEAIHSALSRTDGDFLLLRMSNAAARVDALPRLWATRDDLQIGPLSAGVPGNHGAESPTRIGWLDRLLKWGHAVRVQGATGDSGFRLCRREQLAAEQAARPAGADTYIEHLRRTMDRRQPLESQPAAESPTRHGVPAPKGAPVPILPGTISTPSSYVR